MQFWPWGRGGALCATCVSGNEIASPATACSRERAFVKPGLGALPPGSTNRQDISLNSPQMIGGVYLLQFWSLRLASPLSCESNITMSLNWNPTQRVDNIEERNALTARQFREKAAQMEHNHPPLASPHKEIFETNVDTLNRLADRLTLGTSSQANPFLDKAVAFAKDAITYRENGYASISRDHFAQARKYYEKLPALGIAPHPGTDPQNAQAGTSRANKRTRLNTTGN